MKYPWMTCLCAPDADPDGATPAGGGEPNPDAPEPSESERKEALASRINAMVDAPKAPAADAENMVEAEGGDEEPLPAGLTPQQKHAAKLMGLDDAPAADFDKAYPGVLTSVAQQFDRLNGEKGTLLEKLKAAEAKPAVDATDGAEGNPDDPEGGVAPLETKELDPDDFMTDEAHKHAVAVQKALADTRKALTDAGRKQAATGAEKEELLTQLQTAQADLFFATLNRNEYAAVYGEGRTAALKADDPRVALRKETVEKAALLQETLGLDTFEEALKQAMALVSHDRILEHQRQKYSDRVSARNRQINPANDARKPDAPRLSEADKMRLAADKVNAILAR